MTATPSKGHPGTLALRARAMNDKIEFARMDSKQAQALGMFLEGKTKAQIAKSLEVSIRTIWRWMDTLDFRAHLEQAQRSAINMGRTKLTASANRAVQTLVDALDKKKRITRDQQAAAIAILDRVGLSAKFQIEYESIDDALRKLPPEELRAMLEARLKSDGGLIDAIETGQEPEGDFAEHPDGTKGGQEQETICSDRPAESGQGEI